MSPSPRCLETRRNLRLRHRREPLRYPDPPVCLLRRYGRGDDAGRVIELVIVGELCFVTVEQIRPGVDALLRAYAGNLPPLALDLSGVGFIDGRGLRYLEDLRRTLRAEGSEVWITAASRPVRRLLELVGPRELLVDRRHRTV